MYESFVLISSADRTRPGLCFRMRVPAGALSLSTNRTLNGAGEKMDLDPKVYAVYADKIKVQEPNTTIVQVFEDGTQKSWAFHLTQERLQTFLFEVDQMMETSTGKQGRPEKNVLALTTSKDRRLGQLKARSY